MNQLNSLLTKDELNALQQFLDYKINYNELSESLNSVLLKIGMFAPMSNSGGVGKKIENIIKNNKKEI
jgi:hypothetical protein